MSRETKIAVVIFSVLLSIIIGFATYIATYYDYDVRTTIVVHYTNGQKEKVTLESSPEYIYLDKDGALKYCRYDHDWSGAKTIITHVRRYEVITTTK